MSNGEVISKEVARTMIRKYKDNMDPAIKRAFMFDKDLIQEVLDGAECEGIRIYLGLKTNDEQNAIIVGTNSELEDLTDNTIIELSRPCPPDCDDNSYINT